MTLTLIYSAGLAILSSHGQPEPERAALLWRVAFALFVVRWVAPDRRSYQMAAPFEFSALVFFAWVVVLSYYLYKTRGLRGLLNALGFWLLAVTPSTTALIVRLSR